MKTRTSLAGLASLLAISILGVSANAQSTFTSSGSSAFVVGSSTVPAGTYYDYSDTANWSAGVPNLNDTTNTAVIGDGNNVGYYSGEHGDLIISGGATLYITSGTLTQVDGGSYLDLGRNGGGYGNLVINGGVLNQGTISSTPFNVEGVDNTFLISSGTLNIAPNINLVQNSPNLSWTQTGGVVNGPGPNNEFDVANGATMTINGGQFNLTKLMNLNGVVDAVNFGGGVFNDQATADQGWYAPSGTSFNFTVGSSGTMEFAYGGSSSFASFSAAQSQVNSWITAGDISYNNTTDPAAFNVTDSGGGELLVTDIYAVPEPSTYALIGFGTLGMWVFVRRKKARLFS